MPRIRVRDIEIYYEVQGSGPRLLFIGGSGGDLRNKPGVFDGPLIKRFEVLAFDQRGLGRSDAPAGPYSMADYGEDAAGLIEALSFGPAQELVCRHPEVVTRLVLACTSPGGRERASFPLHQLQDLSDRERAIRMTEISDTRYDARWREANPDDAERLIEIALARTQPRDQEAVRGQHLQLEARSHHDTFERLGNVSQPVYLCAGKHDGIAPPENQHAMAEALPNARLEFFDGGHLFLIQDRSAFKKIADFLLEAT
ncbi:MAG: alpha/beta fold hydrolase [Deltaproteobacteria bacterium]|nr:alpha/beta fold hydrolase [Deltaproteobacteria bacterium]